MANTKRPDQGQLMSEVMSKNQMSPSECRPEDFVINDGKGHGQDSDKLRKERELDPNWLHVDTKRNSVEHPKAPSNPSTAPVPKSAHTPPQSAPGGGTNRPAAGGGQNVRSLRGKKNG